MVLYLKKALWVKACMRIHFASHAATCAPCAQEIVGANVCFNNPNRVNSEIQVFVWTQFCEALSI